MSGTETVRTHCAPGRLDERKAHETAGAGLAVASIAGLSGRKSKATVRVSTNPDVEAAVAEICRAARLGDDIIPNLVITYASVHYSDEMKRLGTNIKALLEKHGTPQTAVVHGSAVLGVGAVVDGTVHTAQRCLPEDEGMLPHSDMMAVLFAEMTSFKACGFYVPPNDEHNKSRSRNKSNEYSEHSRSKGRRQSGNCENDKQTMPVRKSSSKLKSDGLADSFVFHWSFPSPVPGVFRTAPDALFLSSRAMRVDGLFEQYPETSITGALLPNIAGTESGTFIEETTYSSLCGLAFKFSERARLMHVSFGQAESGPEMMKKMSDFAARVRATCTSPLDGVTQVGRPLFAWVVGCFGRYPGAVLSQYTAQGCDFQRVSACFKGLPAVGVFSYGELLPESPKNQQFSCAVAVFIEMDSTEQLPEPLAQHAESMSHHSPFRSTA